ncbi:hypothetical protein [Acetivibrio mesophilus]|uniref:Uncharacterized protein n=1 Tax=Acetivibrio mesophilus TaxID=2487273 RepID=A0A4Q0I6Q8_9FIRM|nr:hypothetical protein [Acetivibrio mesophilus]ODM25891.1 hypothetical protein A7W90_06435 [Clostridium sp. Bc-iso-3]RXE59525.1 hypothetical protein EFD62_06110 [Acetivibrio mesophilus]HHV30001.1 hypothetical protein [Clostridium sp.]
MNYKEIEELKSTLTNMMKKGCTLMVPAYRATGKIVGIGFKPYWTNPADSKIEKLEINFMDSIGRVIPFDIYNIIGYEIVSLDGKRIEDAKNICLDIHLYTNVKRRSTEKGDTLRIEISEISEE